MKKYLLSLLALLVALPANAVTLPLGAEILTSPSQISEFTILGQIGKSGEPGSYLYGIRKDAVFGAYTPVTGYQSRTTQYIAASATTIPVVSTLDKAGNQIDLANISSSGTVKVYLNLAPGTSLEEPIVCTGLTATSWTNCTRGLAFQGSSEIASTSLQKAHNAGTAIIITNIAQFYNQFVATDGNQTVNGNKTFTGTSTFSILPLIPTTTPTDPQHVISLNYLTTVTTTGCANASQTVRGCVEEATDSEYLAGTTVGGTGSNLYVSPSTSIRYSSQNILKNVIAGQMFSAGLPLYVSSTGRYEPLTGGITQAMIDRVAAVSLSNSSGPGSTIDVLLPGSLVTNSLTSLTTSSPVYISNLGLFSATAGTIRKVVGVAVGTNSFIFNPTVQTPSPTSSSNTIPIADSNGNLFGWNVNGDYITAGENLNTREVVYVSSTGSVYKYSSSTAILDTGLLGMTLATTTSGNSAPVLFEGIFTTSGLTTGAVYYTGLTAGSISTSYTDQSIRLGTALSTTKFKLDKSAGKVYDLGAITPTVTVSGGASNQPQYSNSITVRTAVGERLMVVAGGNLSASACDTASATLEENSASTQSTCSTLGGICPMVYSTTTVSAGTQTYRIRVNGTDGGNCTAVWSGNFTVWKF